MAVYLDRLRTRYQKRTSTRVLFELKGLPSRKGFSKLWVYHALEAFIDLIGARGVRSDHDFVNTLACELEATEGDRALGGLFTTTPKAPKAFRDLWGY